MFFTKKKEKALLDKIDVLNHEIEDLRQIVKTQELIKLRAENERLKEKEKLIDKIKFNLKDVGYNAEENAIIVKYSIPNLRVNLNDNGEIMKNEVFYAINKLQIIPLKDMKKIQTLIDEVTKKGEK